MYNNNIRASLERSIAETFGPSPSFTTVQQPRPFRGPIILAYTDAIIVIIIRAIRRRDNGSTRVTQPPLHTYRFNVHVPATTVFRRKFLVLFIPRRLRHACLGAASDVCRREVRAGSGTIFARYVRIAHNRFVVKVRQRTDIRFGSSLPLPKDGPPKNNTCTSSVCRRAVPIDSLPGKPAFFPRGRAPRACAGSSNRRIRHTDKAVPFYSKPAQ